MKTRTTYEQKQLNRLVNELLIKDAWSDTFIRKINQNEILKKRTRREKPISS